MYSDVALNPNGEYHFEMGRDLAEKLGYEKTDLDRIPAAAIESFAGVGYYFHLADLKAGEKVLDLGSGSGMDVFVAALKVGNTGHVSGVDMTDEQLTNSERLRRENTFENVSFHYGEKKLFSNKQAHSRGGEKVGLVGFTGAGKSTFISLILRFFPLHSGKILIDGDL